MRAPACVAEASSTVRATMASWPHGTWAPRKRGEPRPTRRRGRVGWDVSPVLLLGDILGGGFAMEYTGVERVCLFLSDPQLLEVETNCYVCFSYNVPLEGFWSFWLGFGKEAVSCFASSYVLFRQLEGSLTCGFCFSLSLAYMQPLVW